MESNPQGNGQYIGSEQRTVDPKDIGNIPPPRINVPRPASAPFSAVINHASTSFQDNVNMPGAPQVSGISILHPLEQPSYQPTALISLPTDPLNDSGYYTFNTNTQSISGQSSYFPTNSANINGSGETNSLLDDDLYYSQPYYHSGAVDNSFGLHQTLQGTEGFPGSTKLPIAESQRPSMSKCKSAKRHLPPQSTSSDADNRSVKQRKLGASQMIETNDEQKRFLDFCVSQWEGRDKLPNEKDLKDAADVAKLSVAEVSMWIGDKLRLPSKPMRRSTDSANTTVDNTLSVDNRKCIEAYINGAGRKRCTSGQSRRARGGKYYCTWGCSYSTNRRDDWARHEEKKRPQHFWICSGSSCPGQRTGNGIQGPFITHRIDKFRPHAKKYHSKENTNELRKRSKINYTAPFDHQCSFLAKRTGKRCPETFDSWDTRNAHYCDHFEGRVPGEGWYIPNADKSFVHDSDNDNDDGEGEDGDDGDDGDGGDDDDGDDNNGYDRGHDDGGDDSDDGDDDDNDDDDDYNDGHDNGTIGHSDSPCSLMLPGSSQFASSIQATKLNSQFENVAGSNTAWHTILAGRKVGKDVASSICPQLGQSTKSLLNAQTNQQPLLPAAKECHESLLANESPHLLLDVENCVLVRQGPTVRFIALKYLGAQEDIYTGLDSKEGGNEQQHLIPASEGQIPDPIRRKAILLTKEMGFRYLWISTLCASSSSAKADASIYRAAAFVLVIEGQDQIWHFTCGYRSLERVESWAHLRVSFHHLQQLGYGAYGIVDKVKLQPTEETLARKIVFRADARRTLRAWHLQEIEIMQKFNHPHIAKFVGAYYDDRLSFNILMSPVAECDLRQFLASPEQFQGKLAFLPHWYMSLAEALAYIHQMSCRHKDIKPANILISGSTVLLTDFGTSRDFSADVSTSSGGAMMTPKYCAPEVAAGKDRGRSADIFSLGCVFVEMSTVEMGRTIDDLQSFLRFDDCSGNRNAAYYARLGLLAGWLKFLKSLCPNEDRAKVLHITEKMLQAEQQRRPSAKELTKLLCPTGNCTGLKPLATCHCCPLQPQLAPEQVLPSPNPNPDATFSLLLGAVCFNVFWQCASYPRPWFQRRLQKNKRRQIQQLPSSAVSELSKNPDTRPVDDLRPLAIGAPTEMPTFNIYDGDVRAVEAHGQSGSRASSQQTIRSTAFIPRKAQQQLMQRHKAFYQFLQMAMPYNEGFGSSRHDAPMTALQLSEIFLRNKLRTQTRFASYSRSSKDVALPPSLEARAEMCGNVS